MGIFPTKKAAWTALAASTVLVALPATAANAEDGAGHSQSAPRGLALDRDNATIRSAQHIDLTRDFVTLPLHRGTANGETVWFVVTDTSSARIARRLGINHSPKLSNVRAKCPHCAQFVTSDNPVLGEGSADFEGAPDFSPSRSLIPGRTPFPPRSFLEGARARPGYSPYVTVRGSDVVYNAPIVATGDGPFDVTTHTNTHDRTLGIDTRRMTTDHLFIRGFASGQPILYLSFDSSDAFTSALERSTFVPALADLAFANGGGNPRSARASIFTFVNARRGLERNAPPGGASNGPGRAQGLTHAMADGLTNRDAAIANPEVLEGFRIGADVSNIFDVFPTNRRMRDRREYSPAWDLQVGVYSRRAVARGLNGLKQDANRVRRMAARGLVTSPGGAPRGSSNIVINCPALAFLQERPRGPRIPVAGVQP